jgi:hypothetical protein
MRISVAADPVGQIHQLQTTKGHIFNLQNSQQIKGRASSCFVLSDVFHDPIGPRMARQDTCREMTYNITNYHVAGTYGLIILYEL